MADGAHHPQAGSVVRPARYGSDAGETSGEDPRGGSCTKPFHSDKRRKNGLSIRQSGASVLRPVRQVVSQAEDDEIGRQLDAGASLSVDAYGDWEPTVPKGMVGLKFVGRGGVSYRLMPEGDYPNQLVALSAVRTEPWTDHP